MTCESRHNGMVRFKMHSMGKLCGRYGASGYGLGKVVIFDLMAPCCCDTHHLPAQRIVVQQVYEVLCRDGYVSTRTCHSTTLNVGVGFSMLPVAGPGTYMQIQKKA
jgi:hypothetical protein